EYRIQAAKLATNAAFIAMKTVPPDLSAHARFGTGFMYDDKNHSWAVDGDDEHGYRFYGDLNANGDLADDGPRPFVVENGKPTLRLNDRGQDDSGNYPILIKSQLETRRQAGRPDTFSLVSSGTLRRRGQIVIKPGEPPVTFRLTGPRGLFNLSYATLAFDLN